MPMQYATQAIVCLAGDLRDTAVSLQEKRQLEGDLRKTINDVEQIAATVHYWPDVNGLPNLFTARPDRRFPADYRRPRQPRIHAYLRRRLSVGGGGAEHARRDVAQSIHHQPDQPAHVFWRRQSNRTLGSDAGGSS